MPDVSFSPTAWDEYVAWQTQDRRTLRRINELLKDALRQPFDGLGKPEPLRHLNAWSRRIDEKNRLVYQIKGDALIVLSCKGHYES